MAFFVLEACAVAASPVGYERSKYGDFYCLGDDALQGGKKGGSFVKDVPKDEKS